MVGDVNWEMVMGMGMVMVIGWCMLSLIRHGSSRLPKVDERVLELGLPLLRDILWDTPMYAMRNRNKLAMPPSGVVTAVGKNDFHTVISKKGSGMKCASNTFQKEPTFSFTVLGSDCTGGCGNVHVLSGEYTK